MRIAVETVALAKHARVALRFEFGIERGLEVFAGRTQGGIGGEVFHAVGIGG